jgi:hypothetical protein
VLISVQIRKLYLKTKANEKHPKKKARTPTFTSETKCGVAPFPCLATIEQSRYLTDTLAVLVRVSPVVGLASHETEHDRSITDDDVFDRTASFPT